MFLQTVWIQFRRFKAQVFLREPETADFFCGEFASGASEWTMTAADTGEAIAGRALSPVVRDPRRLRVQG